MPGARQAFMWAVARCSVAPQTVFDYDSQIVYNEKKKPQTLSSRSDTN
jgi:hypothetical protein